MFIQTESTPNPATLKFLPGETVAENGPFEFSDAVDAEERSPLAAELFAIPSVSGVFFGYDFVTITKNDTADWQHVKPAVLGVIMEHFMSGAPVMAADAAGGTEVAPEGSWKKGLKRSSPPSRNYWKPACAPPWRRTAATSPSTVSRMVACI